MFAAWQLASLSSDQNLLKQVIDFSRIGDLRVQECLDAVSILRPDLFSIHGVDFVGSE
jgi:hypothetical protein